MNDILSFEEWVRQGKPSSGGKKMGKDPYLQYRSEEEVQAEIGQLKDYSVRAESFLQSVNELTEGKDYYIPSEELIATGKALANEAPTMLRMFNANSRFMQDADTTGEALASYIGTIGDIASTLEEDREYFSQFKDESDYSTQMENAQSTFLTERDLARAYNVDEGSEKIAELENNRGQVARASDFAKDVESNMIFKDNDEIDWDAMAASGKHGMYTENGYTTAISGAQLKADYLRALDLAGMDYASYDQYVQDEKNYHDYMTWAKKDFEYLDLLDKPDFYSIVSNGEAKAKENGDKPTGKRVNEMYKLEKDIWHYLYVTDGKEAADAYVEHLQRKLKEYRTESITRWIESRRFNGAAATLFNLATRGLIDARNLAGIFIDLDRSVWDNVNRNLQNSNKLTETDKWFHQAGGVVGSQLPVMGLKKINPALGSAYQALTTYGASKQDAREMGLSKRRQIAYGAAMAAGEYAIDRGLDKFFGGIGVSGKVDAKIDLIQNKLWRAAAKTGARLTSENIEELTEAILLEPTVNYLFTDQAFEMPGWDEIADTVAITTLSTFLLSAGGITANEFQKQNGYSDTGKKLIGSGSVADLKKSVESYKGSMSDTDFKAAQKLVSKIADTEDGLSQKGQAGMVGQLYTILKNAESGSTASADRIDIKNRLRDKDVLKDNVFDDETANAIADALVANRNGQELSREQRKVLKKYGNDSRVEKVVDSLWGAGEAKLGQKTPAADIYRTAVKTNKLKALGLSDDAAKKMASGDTEGALKSMALSTGRVSVKSVGADGTVTINGKTTSVADADFKSEFQRNAYSAVMGAKNMTPEAANLILGVRANMNGRDIEAALKVYQRGVAGEPIGDVNTTLSKAHIEAIHKAGMRVHSEGVYTAERKVKNIYDRAAKALEKSGEKVTGSLMADEGVDISKLTGTEKRVADLAAEIAPSLSVDIALYRDNDSQSTGFYDYESDTIYLNVASKVDLTTREGKETAMAFTLGHELLHRARVGDPKGYDSFTKFLLSEYGKAGMDVEEMIGEQIALSDAHDKTLPENKRVNMTREMAIEEIAAEACSRMLIDTDAGKKLAAWGQQSKANADFLQKVKQMLQKLINRLRTALNGADPGSEAAKAFMQLDKKVQQILSDMFVDMSKTAAERISTIKSVDEKFAKDFINTRDIAYNLAAQKTHKESLQKKFDAKNASVDLDTLMKRYDKILNIWKDIGIELNSKFLNEWNSKVGTDQAFSVFKAQSGYKYNIELSTMCKKGVALFEAIDTIVKNEVMKELDMKVIGKAEKEILYDILKTDFEIPCAICYVEQARQREGVIIDAFLNGKDTKLGWNSVLDSIEAGMRERGVNYRFESVSRDIATDKYTAADLTMDEKTQNAFFAALMDVANKEIQRYNKAEGKSRKLIKAPTKDGIWDVLKGNVPSNLKIFKVLAMNDGSRFRMDADLLYSSRTTVNLASAHSELYSLFNSQGGASGYKTKQTPVVYWGDLLDKGWKSSTVRDAGAIRNQSNSDSQMYTMLDQVQMYIDLTAKGYYLQAYTKVISELKLLGLSKAKINASLIPKVVVYYNSDGTVDMKRTQENAGLNEKGEPIFDDIEGIDHNEAFMLISDPGYSRSVGGVCIGYSDKHIEALLADPRIQMVIGFHDKTNDPDKRYRGARYSKNYNGLNEAKKLKADGKYETVHVNFTSFLKQAEKKFHWDDATESYVGTIQYKGKTYNADDIPKLAADLYLEKYNVVNDKGERTFIPAYAMFAGEPGKNNSNPNYYKLLADFSLYDSHGHYSPMQKVEYNMPDTVPYLDANGNKQTMKTEEYIKAELEKEMATRDALSLKLADDSDDGIIPRFKKALEDSGRVRNRLAPSPDLSPRTLLTDPNLEGKNQAQKLNLERYRDAIKKADELEGHLNDMEAQYAEYTKEQKKHKMGQELRAEINKTKNRLNMANEDVRKLEQSPPLQTILKNKRSEIFQETAKTAENAESMTVSKEGLEIIENEFTRLARDADSIGDLKAKLKAEAKRHRSDNALWEQRFNKLLREYESSRRINESDRKIIEDEFKRLVEEYEKASADIDDKDAKIERLEYVLEKEAKKHHDDNEMWRQEFKRLLRAYERADRKIDNMKESFKEKEKARVEKNNKNAVKKSIQTKIRDLRKLFARGKDDRNVKSGMRDLVSTTLATADMLFNDSYTEEDMIRNGVSVAISEVDRKLLNRANDILRELESPPATIDAKNLDEFDDVDKLSEWYAETEPKLKRELNQIKHKLEHVFKAERNAIDGMTVSTLMDSLRDAYMELKNSGEEYIRAAYNADNLEMFNSIITNFGSSRIVDMSLSELETLNKVYGIVLGSVRQANKYFAKGKKATIAEKAKLILEDFKAHKPSGGEIKIVAKHISGKMGWNYEKVYYALKRIDSKTFTEMYKDLMRSEDTAQRDMIEALEFRDRLVAKYGYNSWAVNKKMDQVFLDSSGKKFQLTLGEAMSLYAYGRRKSALNNLKNGGFEFAETLLKDPDPATTYKIDEKQFEAIESALTEDQKAFARDMQKYLADVMGAKGNEVSQELYGIDLFTDPYYFPVHIAADYRANVRESTAKKEAGFASQKNAGFTYVKNENAVAPIMLESFLDTWSYHVNEMSRYHASVLPLENIRKVMNYGATDTDLSITAQMKNSYGDAAFDYFNNLYREANSGAITDKLQEKPKKLLSKFRKGSVMYKLSVWFQQPGSITRAEALVDRRYFRGPLGIGRLPIGFTEAVLNRWLGKHNNTYEKMLKYAPGVTMTKELGGFDTATGTSMLAALKDTKKTLWQNIKSGTGKEIAGSVMNLVDDNFIANIPNKMDKVAWIAIWQACENEQKAKHKGMDYNGDAFLELVGERFTEVIQATQVYDSIFAKSPMLKSKNLAVQYLVSFMNEPNTVANMAEDVVRSVSKGKWKDAYKSASAIIRSTILTNALAAFAYAMGDDDEDEKYWESYASHFVSGVVEDANPLSYIPGGKDVYSLTQGYDQERPDMSAWADVVNAIIKERTLSNKDTSEMTDEELEAHEKEQRKASWDLVFTIGNLVGIPVGNIRKEATAIINQIGSKMDDPVSWGAMKSSIEKELWSTIPKWWRPEDSKTDDLYWAIMEGDTTYVERLKKQYKDDDGNFDPDKYDNALKKALQENDPRIKEAAQARLDHDVVTYGTIYNNMVAEGKFTDVVILKAITAEFDKINPDAEKEKNEDPMLDVYGAEEYYFATLYNAGNKDEIYDHLIDNKIADGMTEYEANQSVMTSIANELRDNDVRIEEAATAYLADNYAEYSRIYDEILAEGNFSDEIVSKAVRSKINQLKPDEPTEPKDPDSYKSRFTADDYYKAIMGKSESVDDIYNDLYQNAIADGKSDNEAKKSVTSSIATALRNNDPRVNEAAVAHLDGDVKKRVELVNAMVKDGFSQNAVVAAVDGEINKLSPNNSADTAPKQKGPYRAEDVATSVIAGDSTTASKAFNDLVATNKANGKSPKEAKSAAQSSVKTALRDAYESGDLNKTKAVKSLETYCGMSEDDAKADVIEWDYKKKNPSKDVESGWFDTYVDKVSSSGMPIETYVSYRSKIKGIEGEDKKDRICKVIDSMDISDAQKDALYFANGWASSSKPDWS